MKKEFTLISLALLLICGNIVAQNHTDENGKKQGHWVKTAKNGKKIKEGTFKDDYPVDTFYYYNHEGKVTIKNYFYDKGNKNHTWLMFPNGKVQAEGEYHNKQKQGLWKYYNEKGKRITEVEFKDNEKQGKEKIYDDEGKEVLQITTFDKGKKEGEFFKNLQSYGYYIALYHNDKLNGEYKEYYPTKKLRQTGQYIDGNKEGKWLIYLPSGKVVQEFTYKKDELVEDFVIFSTKEGDKPMAQTDISMVREVKGKMEIYDMQGKKTLTNNDFEQMLEYLNGNRFMRIEEKGNIYMNVVALQGINSDGSLRTNIDFGFKIMPDENGKKIILSLTREDFEE
ncbi:MAG: hypothetical protein Q4Q06_01165 [Bacteroidota bacterium]|nr:hypothetical protein [Bacteroidota bacterium]